MQPRLVVNLDRRTRAARRVLLYSAHPALVVETSATTMGVYCLLPMPSTQLVDRVVKHSELAERPESDASTFQLTSRQVARLREVRGEVPGDLLSELPANAAPFARALAKGRGATHIRCLSRENGKLVGGSISWVDGGDHGLWCLEPLDAPTMAPDDGAPQSCEVRPTTARRLLDDFLALLPGS